jgi:hypothetical protein
MSGSAPTNSQAVDFERQQAAEADAKEAARQQRLTQGQTLIDQIFNGQPVMGTRQAKYDWSTFKPGGAYDQTTGQLTPASGVPAGYTAVQVPIGGAAGGSGAASTTAAAGDAVSAPRYASDTGSSGGGWGHNPSLPQNSPSAAAPTAAVQPMTWALKDANGNIVKQGDPLSYTESYDTGQKTGGFNDDFFNAYKQKVLDYYQPDEQRQYNEAQRDLTYNLARSGMLNSSVAADKQGELAYQDALQKANIVANANAQEGNLKSQIQSNKQSLINQLYSTEDPTLTANLAESSANATRLQDPNLTPAASLFAPALTAVGSAVNGLLYPGQQNYASPFNTAGSSPTPAAANASSGSLKSSGGLGWG